MTHPWQIPRTVHTALKNALRHRALLPKRKQIRNRHHRAFWPVLPAMGRLGRRRRWLVGCWIHFTATGQTQTQTTDKDSDSDTDTASALVKQ
jgi:hypothetical protein